VRLVQSFPGNDFHGDRQVPTVLLVDSDSRVMQANADALRASGFAVLEAVTFEDGKRVWNSVRPDVLVVDVRLGQYNGLQLLMRARADRPDLHAIITCPFADTVLEAETQRFGGTFLIKPLEPWQIVDAVRRVPQRWGPVPVPVTPPHLMDRRRLDRRQQQAPFFHEDRRLSERRRLYV
jgi:two-component system response regulator RegA